ncbi:HAD family hydrolase [Rhodopseudomonas boonkerdii]|uniref:HAD-IA family hydrolase n=1 Tax=Rhodopseudomonas boonkerdii TaxID=475937 RepID=UPI001E5B175A|nr:HAD-IA family hydrolase [Rhodopseudomonas boonkerdii]UGV26831.1 HAD family hydrolase [Rhodopseudomonas boonkerdii]
MTYKLAIFDFDGTLSDSFPWFLSVINQVAEKHKFRRVERDRIDEMRSVGAGELVRMLGVPKWRIPLIVRDMRKMKAQQIDRIALFPGVDRMFDELKARGVTICVVSSDNENNVRTVLGELEEHVSFFACAAGLFGKTAKFQRILELTGVSVDDTLSIGDEIRDIDAAREAGVDFGAVSWGYTSAAALNARAPTFMFSRMDDITVALTTPRG